jgi:hypothetical protein
MERRQALLTLALPALSAAWAPAASADLTFQWDVPERLALPDAAEHEVTLAAGGETRCIPTRPATRRPPR